LAVIIIEYFEQNIPNNRTSLTKNYFAHHSLQEENGKTAWIFADLSFGVSFN
jgi:hypothetical protein